MRGRRAHVSRSFFCPANVRRMVPSGAQSGEAGARAPASKSTLRRGGRVREVSVARVAAWRGARARGRGGGGGRLPRAPMPRRQGRRRGTPVQAGRRLRCSKCDARAGWVEFVDGPLRELEGRVGGRGHDGAVASRAQRRGRREDLWRGMLRRLSASAKVRPRARAERGSAFLF